MKNSTKTTERFSKIVMALALLGALYVSQASAQTLNVDLIINGHQTALLAETRGNCNEANHHGCVQTSKGSSANIHFFLKNEYSDCDKAAGATWELSAVYLGGKNSPTKPGFWGTLDPEVTSDFSFADAASGRLNHENGSNKRKISITDKNDYAYDIWYTVEASCVGSDGAVLGTLKLDPRVSNVGN